LPTRVRGRKGGSRALVSPRGLAVRPTSARVREAIFNILGQRCDGDRVLDLYAGTGALAIEAGARGAAELVLVEHDPAAIEAIHANLARMGLTERAEVLPLDAAAAVERLARRGVRFDLVLADPPYGTGEVGRVLGALAAHPILAERGVVVLEHAHREEPPGQVGTLQCVDQRRYGQTAVCFYREEAVEDPRATTSAAKKGDPA